MGLFVPIAFAVAFVMDGLMEENAFGIADGFDNLVDGLQHTIKYLKYEVRSDSAKEEIRNKMLDYIDERYDEVHGNRDSSEYNWQRYVACENIKKRLEENELIEALELIEADLEDARDREEDGENLDGRIEFYEDFYKGR